MLIVGQENTDSPIEITPDGGTIYAMAFTANGEYLLSGGDGNIQVWRVEDTKKITTMEVTWGDDVLCLAVSKDVRWIAAGTDGGKCCFILYGLIANGSVTSVLHNHDRYILFQCRSTSQSRTLSSTEVRSHLLIFNHRLTPCSVLLQRGVRMGCRYTQTSLVAQGG